MWHTVVRPAPAPPQPGLAPSPAWVRFDFVRPMTFDSIVIWNHNQAKLTDRGFRRTRIYGSADGVTWRPLTRSGAIELPRASGSPYALPTTVPNDAPSRPLRAVTIAAEATDGNHGGDCYGLSAVRFAVRRYPVPGRSAHEHKERTMCVIFN